MGICASKEQPTNTGNKPNAKNINTNTSTTQDNTNTTNYNNKSPTNNNKTKDSKNNSKTTNNSVSDDKSRTSFKHDHAKTQQHDLNTNNNIHDEKGRHSLTLNPSKPFVFDDLGDYSDSDDEIYLFEEGDGIIHQSNSKMDANLINNKTSKNSKKNNHENSKKNENFSPNENSSKRLEEEQAYLGVPIFDALSPKDLPLISRIFYRAQYGAGDIIRAPPIRWTLEAVPKTNTNTNNNTTPTNNNNNNDKINENNNHGDKLIAVNNTNSNDVDINNTNNNNTNGVQLGNNNQYNTVSSLSTAMAKTTNNTNNINNQSPSPPSANRQSIGRNSNNSDDYGFQRTSSSLINPILPIQPTHQRNTSASSTQTTPSTDHINSDDDDNVDVDPTGHINNDELRLSNKKLQQNLAKSTPTPSPSVSPMDDTNQNPNNQIGSLVLTSSSFTNNSNNNTPHSAIQSNPLVTPTTSPLPSSQGGPTGLGSRGNNKYHDLLSLASTDNSNVLHVIVRGSVALYVHNTPIQQQYSEHSIPPHCAGCQTCHNHLIKPTALPKRGKGRSESSALSVIEEGPDDVGVPFGNKLGALTEEDDNGQNNQNNNQTNNTLGSLSEDMGDFGYEDNSIGALSVHQQPMGNGSNVFSNGLATMDDFGSKPPNQNHVPTVSFTSLKLPPPPCHHFLCEYHSGQIFTTEKSIEINQNNNTTLHSVAISLDHAVILSIPISILSSVLTPYPRLQLSLSVPLASLASTNFTISLQNIPFFRHMSPQKLSILSRLFTVRKAEPNRVIFREGQKSDGIYLLLDGSCEVTAKNSSNVPVYLNTITPGQWFGEHAMVGICTPTSSDHDNDPTSPHSHQFQRRPRALPRASTVTTLKSSMFLFLHRRRLRRFFALAPELLFGATGGSSGTSQLPISPNSHFDDHIITNPRGPTTVVVEKPLVLNGVELTDPKTKQKITNIADLAVLLDDVYLKLDENDQMLNPDGSLQYDSVTGQAITANNEQLTFYREYQSSVLFENPPNQSNQLIHSPQPSSKLFSAQQQYKQELSSFSSLLSYRSGEILKTISLFSSLQRKVVGAKRFYDELRLQQLCEIMEWVYLDANLLSHNPSLEVSTSSSTIQSNNSNTRSFTHNNLHNNENESFSRTSEPTFAALYPALNFAKTYYVLSHNQYGGIYNEADGELTPGMFIVVRGEVKVTENRLKYSQLKKFPFSLDSNYLSGGSMYHDGSDNVATPTSRSVELDGKKNSQNKNGNNNNKNTNNDGYYHSSPHADITTSPMSLNRSLEERDPSGDLDFEMPSYLFGDDGDRVQAVHDKKLAKEAQINEKNNQISENNNNNDNSKRIKKNHLPKQPREKKTKLLIHTDLDQTEELLTHSTGVIRLIKTGDYFGEWLLLAPPNVTTEKIPKPTISPTNAIHTLPQQQHRPSSSSSSTTKSHDSLDMRNNQRRKSRTGSFDRNNKPLQFDFSMNNNNSQNSTNLSNNNNYNIHDNNQNNSETTKSQLSNSKKNPHNRSASSLHPIASADVQEPVKILTITPCTPNTLLLVLPCRSFQRFSGLCPEIWTTIRARYDHIEAQLCKAQLERSKYINEIILENKSWSKLDSLSSMWKCINIPKGSIIYRSGQELFTKDGVSLIASLNNFTTNNNHNNTISPSSSNSSKLGNGIVVGNNIINSINGANNAFFTTPNSSSVGQNNNNTNNTTTSHSNMSLLTSSNTNSRSLLNHAIRSHGGSTSTNNNDDNVTQPSQSTAENAASATANTIARLETVTYGLDIPCIYMLIQGFIDVSVPHFESGYVDAFDDGSFESRIRPDGSILVEVLQPSDIFGYFPRVTQPTQLALAKHTCLTDCVVLMLPLNQIFHNYAVAPEFHHYILKSLRLRLENIVKVLPYMNALIENRRWSKHELVSTLFRSFSCDKHSILMGTNQDIDLYRHIYNQQQDGLKIKAEIKRKRLIRMEKKEQKRLEKMKQMEMVDDNNNNPLITTPNSTTMLNLKLNNSLLTNINNNNKFNTIPNQTNINNNINQTNNNNNIINTTPTKSTTLTLSVATTPSVNNTPTTISNNNPSITDHNSCDACDSANTTDMDDGDDSDDNNYQDSDAEDDKKFQKTIPLTPLTSVVPTVNTGLWVLLDGEIEIIRFRHHDERVGYMQPHNYASLLDRKTEIIMQTGGIDGENGQCYYKNGHNDETKSLFHDTHVSTIPRAHSHLQITTTPLSLQRPVTAHSSSNSNDVMSNNSANSANTGTHGSNGVNSNNDDNINNGNHPNNNTNTKSNSSNNHSNNSSKNFQQRSQSNLSPKNTLKIIDQNDQKNPQINTDNDDVNVGMRISSHIMHLPSHNHDNDKNIEDVNQISVDNDEKVEFSPVLSRSSSTEACFDQSVNDNDQNIGALSIAAHTNPIHLNNRDIDTNNDKFAPNNNKNDPNNNIGETNNLENIDGNNNCSVKSRSEIIFRKKFSRPFFFGEELFLLDLIRNHGNPTNNSTQSFNRPDQSTTSSSSAGGRVFSRQKKLILEKSIQSLVSTSLFEDTSDINRYQQYNEQRQESFIGNTINQFSTQSQYSVVTGNGSVNGSCKTNLTKNDSVKNDNVKTENGKIDNKNSKNINKSDDKCCPPIQFGSDWDLFLPQDPTAETAIQQHKAYTLSSGEEAMIVTTTASNQPFDTSPHSTHSAHSTINNDVATPTSVPITNSQQPLFFPTSQIPYFIHTTKPSTFFVIHDHNDLLRLLNIAPEFTSMFIDLVEAKLNAPLLYGQTATDVFAPLRPHDRIDPNDSRGCGECAAGLPCLCGVLGVNWTHLSDLRTYFNLEDPNQNGNNTPKGGLFIDSGYYNGAKNERNSHNTGRMSQNNGKSSVMFTANLFAQMQNRESNLPSNINNNNNNTLNDISENDMNTMTMTSINNNISGHNRSSNREDLLNTININGPVRKQSIVGLLPISQFPNQYNNTMDSISQHSDESYEEPVIKTLAQSTLEKGMAPNVLFANNGNNNNGQKNNNNNNQKVNFFNNTVTNNNNNNNTKNDGGLLSPTITKNNAKNVKELGMNRTSMRLANSGTNDSSRPSLRLSLNHSLVNSNNGLVADGGKVTSRVGLFSYSSRQKNNFLGMNDHIINNNNNNNPTTSTTGSVYNDNTAINNNINNNIDNMTVNNSNIGNNTDMIAVARSRHGSIESSSATINGRESIKSTQSAIVVTSTTPAQQGNGLILPMNDSNNNNNNVDGNIKNNNIINPGVTVDDLDLPHDDSMASFRMTAFLLQQQQQQTAQGKSHFGNDNNNNNNTSNNND